MDSIDYIIKQWKNECPELDTSAMALIGRLKKITMILSKRMEKNFERFNLNASSFDVLATLRRAGAPYTLSPRDLIEKTMVTSGTMTNRIDQLEKQGLVERQQNPEDARGCLICLSDKGYHCIDEVLKEHVTLQKELLAGLEDKQKDSLNSLLSQYLSLLETKR